MHDQKGQSLVELLVGLGIISIMIGSSTYALISVLRDSTVNEQNQSAGLIGNSLLESASTLTEANWNAVYNLQKGLTSHYFLAKSPTTTPTVVAGDEGILEQDITNGLVGYWKFDEISGTAAYDYSGQGNLGVLTNIPDINSGLVGYWKFDDGSGTTAKDSSVNNYTGTLANSPTWTSALNCRLGGCLNFSYSYVNIGSQANLNNLQQFTIVAWVKAGDWHHVSSILNNGSENSTKHIWLGWWGSSYNRMSLEVADGTSYYELWGPSGLTWQPGVWYQIAVTFDNVTKTFQHYRDGLPSGSAGTFTQNIDSGSGGYNIGSYVGAGHYFNGLIDDVRIYNRVLSASEVQRLYYINNCKVGSCMSFDGVNDYINIPGTNIQLGSNDFTLSVWVKPNSLSAVSDILSDANGNVIFRMGGIYGNRAILFLNGWSNYRYSGNFSSGEWNHIVFVKQGQDLHAYINNVLADSSIGGTIPVTIGTLGTFNIGYLNSYLNGSLDDFRIYNRALSVSEISQIYNSAVYSRYFYVDNVKRTVCGTGDITTDAESTCVGTSGVSEDPATQKIVVGTSWNIRGVAQVLENYIYVTRWVNSAAEQNNWSGNSGIDTASSSFGSNYFSSTGIATTTTGTIKVSGI